MEWFSLIWLVFIILTILPVVKQKAREKSRVKLIRKIEHAQNARVIVLIHRQEALSFLGIPFRRYIDIEDSEDILRAIRLTPADRPICMVIHTPGGLVLAAEQIAHALQRHPAPVTVVVPHYAMSGGTLIALAADQILMDENAVLGPVDPQIGSFPAPSLKRLVAEKDINKIEDETLILADVAGKALSQVKELVGDLLDGKMGEEKSRELSDILTAGYWTHDYPITVDKLKLFGLPVGTEFDPAIYQLMDLYPQSGKRRPSVQYIN